MATLQGLLASLLNSNPGAGGLLSDAGYLQSTGLGPQQMQRYQQGAGMPTMAPAGPAQPQQAPQAPTQPDMQQTASTAPSGGGLGGMLQGIFAPKAAQRNKTVQLLMEDGLDEGTATLVSQDKGSLTAYLRQRAFGGGSKQSDFDQRAQAAQQYGMQPGTPEFQSFVLSGDMPEARGGAAEVGLQAQYGVDANGNPVILQLGKDAVARQAQMPEGVRLSKEPIKLDAGTHWVLLDPITRQPVGQIEKDLAGAEEAKVTGKGTGEAVEAFRSMTSKMPGLETVVSELDTLANQATYTLAGQTYDWGRAQVGMEPREAAIARTKYTAMVDNQVLPLLKDTFGAQFTVTEGETLRKTLGDPDKTPAEKQEVLRAFIEQKRRDVEALAARTGQSQGGAGGGERSFTNEKQIFDGIADGSLKEGDVIILNGKRMRIDP